MRPHDNGTAPPVIRYGTGITAAGRVVVALTERGLCALRLLEDATLSASVDELHRKFPRAELVEDPKAARPMVAQVNAVLEGREDAAAVPLDLQGTAFQQRVWQTLLMVPRGTTWSYTQLAARIGQPRAVRAVASACARNPIGLIVPCHRIVRCDGTLGGYYWGLERKRALLRLEQAVL